jgi:hypothetical protein
VGGNRQSSRRGVPRRPHAHLHDRQVREARTTRRRAPPRVEWHPS